MTQSRRVGQALAFALREDCDADFEAEAFARLLEALPQAGGWAGRGGREGGWWGA